MSYCLFLTIFQNEIQDFSSVLKLALLGVKGLAQQCIITALFSRHHQTATASPWPHATLTKIIQDFEH